MNLSQNLKQKESPNIPFEERDINENQCFICRQGGTLACCDYANSVMNASRILCTICKQPAHLDCNIKAKHLIDPSYFESILLGCQAYVCRACLKGRGIMKFHKIKRQTYEYNHQTIDGIVALVKVNHPSPVHLGWFLQDDIRQAYEIQESSSPLNQVQRDEYEAIQRIITMRIPSIYEEKDFQAIVEILLDNERISNTLFGGCHNFYFLTKWARNQHENLVWEDEVVIRQCSGGKQSLAKYLKCKQFQLKPSSSNKFGFIEDAYKKKHMSLIQLNSDASFERMARQRHIYPVQVISFNNMEQGIAEMCYLFNQIFILEEQQYPVIVIALHQTLSLWKSQLRKYCPHLDSLFFTGSDKSINTIKATYFCKGSSQKHPSIRSNFQILVIQEQEFVQHQQFIFRCLGIISIIVFANFQGQQLLRCYGSCHLNIKTMAKNHIFLTDKSKFANYNQKQIFSKIDMFFGCEYILKHDMSKKNMEVLQPILPRGTQTALDSQLPIDNRFFKHARLSELKRVCFLRYVLQFGISMQNNSSLYQRLHLFAPQVFDSLSVKNKSIFGNYLTSFLSLLASYSENKPQPKAVQYYLFQCNLNEVIERIVQLESLGLTLKNKKILELPNFEVYDESQMEKLGDIKNWSTEDDLVLGNLILIQGFGSWQKIYDNKNWMKFNPRKCGRKEGLGFAFGTYLKLKLMTVIRRANIDALTVIAQRAQKILQVVSDSV